MSLSSLTRSWLAAAILSALAATMTGPCPAAAQASDKVSASTLGALDLWSTPGRDTGLGHDLWRGSSASLVADILRAAADRPISPALAAVGRRALATGAAAPDGGGGDPALAALRAHALITLGDPAAAFATIARAPRAEASEPLSRARAQAALLNGQDAAACETAQALEQDRDGAFWSKLRAFCAGLNGHSGAAQVALDLWRQAGGKDAAFDRLAGAAASGPGAEPPQASLADPIDLALSRRLGLDPSAALAAASPSAVAAIVQVAGFPPSARLEAAAAALRLGLISGNDARAIYLSGAEAGGPAAQDPNVADLAREPGAAAEAALYRIAARAADPLARDQAVMALLARGRYAGGFAAMSALVAPALPEIARTGAPLSDPLRFAAAAAAAGDTATADLVRGRIEQDKTPAATPRALALLDALIATGSGRAAGPVLDRLAEQAASGEAGEGARAADAAQILLASGQPLTSAARAEIAALKTPAPLAPAPQLLLLELDGADGLKGETAMLALGVAEAQPTGPSMADRARIIAALRQSGLNDDARGVAVESLLVLFLARP